MRRRLHNLSDRNALLAVTVSIALATALAATSGRSEDDPVPLGVPAAESVTPGPPAAALIDKSRHLGSASCSASSCHGAATADRPSRCATTIWAESDPHARAGSVLRTSLAKQIAEKAGLGRPADQAWECLVCHSPASISVDGRSAATSLEGVSCEACHGPARDWLEPHRSSAWRDENQWSAERKAAAGFCDTRSIVRRASACAKCHIGDEGFDVNHDFIAAGHPRLVYEFSAFNSLMPAHWSRQDDQRRAAAGSSDTAASASFDARAWQVGQLVSASQSLNLLESRCRKAGAWPELAEFDCYSCHHQLGNRPGVRSESRRSSNPSYGSWMLSPALLTAAGPAARQLENDLALFRPALQQWRPDPEKALSTAAEFRRNLKVAEQDALARPLTSGDIRAMLEELLSPPRLEAISTWDEAAQLYLAVVPLMSGYRESLGQTSLATPDEQALLERLRAALSFPVRGTTSGRGFVKLNSPGYVLTGEELERLRHHFAALRLLFPGATGSQAADPSPF